MAGQEKEYYAHRSEEGRLQTLAEHLEEVSRLAGAFAAPFRSSSFAEILGKMHDLSKATGGFQDRLLRNGQKVDHSTFGAQVLNEKRAPILAYPVAGHHGGLPDGGSTTDPDSSVLARRLAKQVEPCEGKYRHYLSFAVPRDRPIQFFPGRQVFSLSFWVRMLFSCLVDADYLDTERFMDGMQPRGEFAGIAEMHASLETDVRRFDTPSSAVHRMRNEILAGCRRSAALSPGLFTLTVPTGGGKTIASLCFAFDHAMAKGKRRVIYCMPYTSIIEQNGRVFQDIVGKRNVLLHYADAFVNEDLAGDDDDGRRRMLAAENWDCNLILTSNVQFFESLFASKPAKCRKLHRIADSVIVLDEAQMLPRNYLKPSVAALEELCSNYGCSVVLMSATQPSLSHFFSKGAQVRELNPSVDSSFVQFKRAQIRHMGSVDMDTLAERLLSHQQVFCIVNTRRRAHELYKRIASDDTFHLSTLMLPVDREQTLKEIRRRLELRLPCRVVATSMIEAGVDFDFPVGYREQAGLDSIIQAAGRVNREGRNPLMESFLYVFTLEGAALRGEVHQAAQISKLILDQFEDVTSPDAVRAYFDRLFDVRRGFTDAKDIMGLLADDRGGSIPFRTIAEQFRVIELDTVPIFVRRDELAQSLAQRLLQGERSKALLRAASAYCVQVHRQELDGLMLGLQLLSGEEPFFVLEDRVWEQLANGTERLRYSPRTGLSLDHVEGGLALMC